MHHVLSVDQHAPVDHCQGQIIQEYQEVPVEQAHKRYESVDVDLIGSPLGNLIGEIEGLNQSLVHVIMREVEIQRA